MFSTIRNNNVSTKVVQKNSAYCDVCFRKGLPPSEYQSHNPKSANGVTCPTILAANCNYCGKSGHWANEKYCSALRFDNQVKEKEKAKAKTPVARAKVVSEKKPTNRFAALDNDSEDEEERPSKNNKKTISTPAVAVGPTPVVPMVPVPTTTSWADMAKKPASLRSDDKAEDLDSKWTLLGQKAFVPYQMERREALPVTRTWDWSNDPDSSAGEEEDEDC